MSFGTNLKVLLKERSLIAKDLAEYMNVSRGLITHWTNDIRNPNPKQVKKILEFLKVDADALFDNVKKQVKNIPIIGTASCGGIDTNHLQDTNRFAPYNGDFYKTSLYCLIANGDSMAPEIEDGDEVICDPDVDPQNGDIVHYTIGSESAIKVYYKDEEAYIAQFIPYNPNEEFKTKTIRLDDSTASEIKISKVVAVNKLKFNNRLSRLKLIGKA